MNLDDLLHDKYSHGTFRDAIIEAVDIDYVSSTAIINCSVCVGDPRDSDEKQRELRASGRLKLSGLLYFIIEPPDSKSTWQQTGGLWIADDGPIVKRTARNKTTLPDSIPKNAFEHYFFVNNWNAFIYTAAKAASFDWT